MKTTRKAAGKKGDSEPTLKRKNKEAQPEVEKRVKVDYNFTETQKQLFTMMFNKASEKPKIKDWDQPEEKGISEGEMSVDPEESTEILANKPKSPEVVPPPAPVTQPTPSPPRPTANIPSVSPPYPIKPPISSVVPAASKPISPPSSTRNLEIWTDKYTPKSLREVAGNRSQIDKVVAWITNWSAKSQFKAVLVSGSPGIGKTTTMRLIAEKLGFLAQELNASDLRNKDAVETRLKDARDNRGIAGFKQCTKTAVIMDEIDGMSGGDKGGVAALIEIIKKTQIPILCICNDRSCPKLKSLSKYCMDIRFSKPTSHEIVVRLQQIASAEKITIDENVLEVIAQSSGLDLRQSVNMMQLHTRGYSWSAVIGSKKDQCVLMNKFQAVSRLWGGKVLKHSEKMNLFFVDFDFVPMLIQENYLSTVTDLESMSRAADSIAFSDTIQTAIKSQNDWSLLPVLGQASTIEPVTYARCPPENLQFPDQLAKMSTHKKAIRIRSEVKDCIAPVAHISSEDSVSEYAHLIALLFVQTLQAKGKSGISDIAQLLETYHMPLEVVKTNCMEISPVALRSAFTSIDRGVKSALTKAISKQQRGKTVDSERKEESSEEEAIDAGEEDVKI